jgi:Sortase domain
MPTAVRSARSLTIGGLAISLLLFGATGVVATGSDSVAPPAILGVPPAVSQGSMPAGDDRDGRPSVAPAAETATATGTVRPAPRLATIAAKAVPKAPAKRPAAPRASAPAFKGRNHVWVPALRIDRSVSFFPCSSSAYPGNRVYRWGCAGSNNVYLFGHAGSVFRPLHDAYVRGHLKKGMTLYYANAAGTVSRYAVSWWRVTTPDRGEFAYASQSRPTLTLQTCLGSNSQYRLIVRLARVG